MPFATRNDVRLYWRLEGESDRPVLLLLNSIATDMALWDACVPALLRTFRVLRMDTRGHGASDVPPGDYTLTMLANDVVAVLDAAGITHAAVAGVSLGGMIAMQLALDHPDRVSALALVCTSATMDSAAWSDRVATVRRDGMEAIADLAMGRFLSPAFAAARPAVAASIRRALVAMDPAGYAGAGAAIRDMALVYRLPAIVSPTLVVAGTRDTSTPYEPHARVLVKTIPGATSRVLEAAHLLPIEAPDALAAALRQFLLPVCDAGTEVAEATMFESGLTNRRRVLGNAWVDRSLANRTPFTADFQAFITRIAWHEIWGRGGLDDRTRRFLVLAITAALGRWEEFDLHVRAGLTQGGFDTDELKEVLMQLAIYAGVPAANTAFARAGAILREIDEPVG